MNVPVVGVMFEGASVLAPKTAAAIEGSSAMLERLNDMPRGVDGLRALGKLSKDDYERVLEPLLEEACGGGRRGRFLCELGPDFEGLTPGAAWEDAKLGLRYLRLLDGCAVVTDFDWIRESTKLARFFLPCPVRVFRNQERGAAIEWLRSLPEPALSHRLLPDAGVMVVEVDRALRAQDFDAVALSADMWIEAHGRLHGLVIHARAFPGWENLGSLVRHLRFVRNHHRKIDRIALAVDVKLAVIAPLVAEHFIQAEVKVFGFDELDASVTWAGGLGGVAARR